MKALYVSFITALALLSFTGCSTKPNETETSVNNEQESTTELSKENNTPTVSFAEAEAFMQNRCVAINQTLVRKMRTRFDGTTVYLFMSVAEDGTVCVSSISEYALEVLAADCGSLERKLEEWNNIQSY